MGENERKKVGIRERMRERRFGEKGKNERKKCWENGKE